MDTVLRRFASALALGLLSSCFSPGGNSTDTSSETGSSSSTSVTTGTGVVTTEGPTGEPTTESTTAPTTEPTSSSGPGTSTGTSGSSSSTTGAPESCSDGAQNGDETDLDCGGSCPACAGGLDCKVNGDCVTMACLDTVCLVEPECLSPESCPAATCFAPSCVDFACGEVLEPDGASCDDGQVCTADETCGNGVCKGTTPKPLALVDLPQEPGLGLYFDGAMPGDQAGFKVGDAGDFNGDGIRDIYVVGLKRVYVLFGGPTLATATLAKAAMGDGGMMIQVDVNNLKTLSVAAVGNVNDDDGKLADLIIGTEITGNLGAAYVVPGRADPAPIKLSMKPADVIRIAGIDNMTNSGFGAAVAGLGDIDNDGINDFAIAAPSYLVNALGVGAVFVVRGTNALADGKVQTYVMNGVAVRIEGPVGHKGFGVSIAGVGDFNKDGRRDLAVGQLEWSGSRGRAYVLYTPAMPTSFQLEAIPAASVGLAVSGSTMLSDHIGRAISGAGDFNDDGFADVIVGTGSNLKQVLVVYGGNYGAEVLAKDLVMIKRGSVISTAFTDFNNSAVGGGGDVNGDGVDDVVIGGPSGSTGQAYVVFGAKGDPFKRTVVELTAGKGGYAIAGAGLTSETGIDVDVIPSVNDDTLADVLLGARGFDLMANSNEGRVYLTYGGDCKG